MPRMHGCFRHNRKAREAVGPRRDPPASPPRWSSTGRRVEATAGRCRRTSRPGPSVTHVVPRPPQRLPAWLRARRDRCYATATSGSGPRPWLACVTVSTMSLLWIGLYEVSGCKHASQSQNGRTDERTLHAGDEAPPTSPVKPLTPDELRLRRMVEIRRWIINAFEGVVPISDGHYLVEYNVIQQQRIAVCHDFADMIIGLAACYYQRAAMDNWEHAGTVCHHI
jgi:hypothetical protein